MEGLPRWVADLSASFWRRRLFPQSGSLLSAHFVVWRRHPHRDVGIADFEWLGERGPGGADSPLCSMDVRGWVGYRPQSLDATFGVWPSSWVKFHTEHQFLVFYASRWGTAEPFFVVVFVSHFLRSRGSWLYSDREIFLSLANQK